MQIKNYSLPNGLMQQTVCSADMDLIGSLAMRISGVVHSSMTKMLLVASLVLGLMPATASAQTALQNISFSSLPGSRLEIELRFSSTPPTPEVFMLESPARLTMDFPSVRSELEERRFPLNFDIADSVMILEAQGRTRMVVNLNNSAPYETRVQGTSLFVMIGAQTSSAATVTAAPAPASTAGNNAGFAAMGSRGSDINGIDFRRNDNNTGQIIIDLANASLNADIRQVGTRLLIEFRNATLDRAQQSRLDVQDYATAVQTVSLYNENGNVVVLAEIAGEYEYLAYQNANQYIVNVMTVAPVTANNSSNVTAFSGEPISLSFQSIDVRTLLQILAEFNGFNLVIGDSVTGTMALHLDNVPSDQALDMVLRPRGLGKRLVGNVLYVAPAEEIAQAELAALETTQQTEALAPLVTDYIEVNYATAGDLMLLLQGGGAAEGAASGGILSVRGRAAVDARTNTIIIQDVQSVIDEVKSLFGRLDVPVRQVLIEARIVNASTSFSKALGIRWGGAQSFPQSADQFLLTGSMDSTIQLENNIADYSRAVSTAVSGGSTLEDALSLNSLVGPSFPEALFVDLGVETAGASSLSIGYQGDNGLLQLELSALESSGNGEVIAQPKVTTQDQQRARIESGLQIPYQAQAGGTAGGSTTEFVTAALSLEVTPQITPDGRIIMLLDIHQDSIVPGSGSVPAISTNSVTTRVLVNDGDTIVLGGVFREETTTSVTKTPLLGDLPYIGNLFKRTENSETKTELLIFITPSIINDLM